jgi:hypothetical protein
MGEARAMMSFDHKPLVAVVHLPPSLGYPECPGVAEGLSRLRADLSALGDRFDGILLENDNDKPHTLTVDDAQVAWLTRMCSEARALTRVALGVGVQRIDWRAALGIAAAAGLDFVRLDVFVDTVVMLGQRIAVDPAEVRARRVQLGAEHIALWTDVHVKHAELAEHATLTESAERAVREGSDAVLITGARTGEPPDVGDLLAARRAVAGRRPVYVGSGLRPELAASLEPHADGALVGTALKRGDRIDAARAEAMVEAWRASQR